MALTELEKLEQERALVEQRIREAHEVLKDLRAATREAKDAFHEVVQEAMDEHLKEARDAIDGFFTRATEAGVKAIEARFRRMLRYLIRNKVVPQENKQLLGETDEEFTAFLAEVEAIQNGGE